MLSVFIYKFHKTLFLIPFDMTMCVGVWKTLVNNSTYNIGT